MMSTLSEITANVAALEKRIIEMTSNNMDEKHKCPLYPLQDAAGTDILFQFSLLELNGNAFVSEKIIASHYYMLCQFCLAPFYLYSYFNESQICML